MKYNSSKQKTPFIFYLGLTLLLMVMLTTHMSTGLLARYMSFSEGGDSARAASFAIEVGETLTQSFELSLKPGESQTKKISITCKSEVAVNYTVKAETVGNLPLTLSWEEQSGSFGAGGTETKSHELVISWAENEDSYLYSYEIDYITVTIICEQAD